MTLGVSTWLWILLPPLLLGVGLLRLLGLGPRTGGVAYLGWLWAAGAVAHGLLVLAWMLVGLPLAPTGLALAAAGLGLLLAAAARWRPAAQPQPPAGWLLPAVLLLGLALFALQILHANALPVTVGDEAAIWAAKAKALFVAGSDPVALQRELQPPLQPFVLHPDYPMLNPLLQLQVFLQAGRITHVDNRIPVQLGALALLCALAGALRHHGRAPVGAVVLLAVAVAAPALGQAGPAFSDLLVALGAVLLADGWLRRDAAAQPEGRALVCLGAAVLLFSKNEGLLILLAFAALLFVTGQRRLRWHPPMSLPVAVFAAGLWFNLRHGLGSDLLAPDPGSALLRLFTQLPAHAPAVARWFVVEILLDPAHSCGVLLLCMVLAVIPGPRTGARLLCALAVLVLAGYALVFLSTPHEIGWHLETAAGRIAFHMVPLAALAVAAWAQPPDA